MELEPNRKLFPDHLPSIFHGAMVGAKFPLAHYKLQKSLNSCQVVENATKRVHSAL